MLNLTSIGGLISIGGFGAYCAFALETWSEARQSGSLYPGHPYHNVWSPTNGASAIRDHR